MAVIHPVPIKPIINVRKPPNRLNFDGVPVSIAPKRYEPKNIPEHLLTTLDEETKARLKAERSRPQTSQSPTKKMSLGEQKLYQAELKRKKEVQ